MRELYERLLRDREARGVSHDVPVEDIVAVVERRGSEDERAAILNRLLATTEGRRELDLVRAAVKAAVRPARTRRYMMPMAIAATLLVAVIGRVLLRDEGAADPVRGEGGAVVLRTPSETIDRADSIRFVWDPVAGAGTYDLELLDDAGNLVWSQSSPATTVTLPDTVQLRTGIDYRWRVVARTEAGNIVSTARRLRITDR